MTRDWPARISGARPGRTRSRGASIPLRPSRDRGFTLIELVAVAAIIAIIASLLLPAVNRARLAAKSTACRNSLRQLGIALNLYLSEFQTYPLIYASTGLDFGQSLPGSFWYQVLDPYSRGAGVGGVAGAPFWCPFEPRFKGAGFLYNAFGTKEGSGCCVVIDGVTTFYDPISKLGLGVLGWPNVPVPESRVLAPSEMIAAGETEGFGFPGPRLQGYVHGRSANAVFCDGHVESSNPNAFARTGPPDSPQFLPDASRWRRFNNDNLPHLEEWKP